ncbi:hypothetical protein [Ramlibacter sp. WS9]|uniref:hypothetical protein n=1 Tax=Ramlibacter sp. WS9 TaxID=1882741 RepID=UPI001143A07F|nr:hypothetical protein [Ramlibacter sp. WS9]ROZ62945.1 hypothetical protein EEB15_30545 [Ramlibacter sp. WS9]
MKNPAPAAASALNREIIDDRDDRLAIHTHQIRLTQAHLPYQPVPGKRLASEKHFAVYADQIILAGVLQNPGRNIELNAREIVIEKPATLDAAGAYADKDFAPGALPVQKDASLGAAGTNGDDATVGGNGGNIVINARSVVNRTKDGRALAVTDFAAIGQQVFTEHPPKVDNVRKLASFEFARTKMFSDNEVAITLEDGRIEGLAKLSLESARFDSTASLVAMRFDVPALVVAGKSQWGNPSTKPFGCKIDAVATVDGAGKISALQTDLSLVTDAPLKLPIAISDGTLGADVLKMLGEQIAGHLRASAIEPLLAAFGTKLRAATLTLVAGGGRGGRGQDGHPGNRGKSGADGAKSSKSGALINGAYGFPEDAYGSSGFEGGRAGSPGLSANGGKGGQVVLNIMEPLSLSVVYGTGGGDGGAQASPGERGPGGQGGAGAVCNMYDASNGRPLDDMRAPNGPDGPAGPVATGKGSKGETGAAGPALQFNGKPFAAGNAPAFSFTALAQALSLSQLLITQNATDLDFLNAKNEADLNAVALGYEWLIDINRPFTDSKTEIDAARVSPLEQKVRGGIHNSAIVSLMRLQQGLDYYGHSYNWTPILTLNSLVARTGEIISLGKVVEDQYNRYLDKGATDKQRMVAFRQAKQEIDRKLGDFLSEIEKLKPQIENFRTEVEDYSEDLRRQLTVLLEGQLKFKDELIKHLREEADIGFKEFLDMLGTVIGCVGGVVGGAGGIKTAIDAVKKAEEFSKQVKGVVEIFKKAKATLDSIGKAYSTVKDFITDGNPNAAKILVDSDEFNDLIKKYLGKFDAAGELRKAMDYYLELSQARNMAAYNYTTLVAQMLSVQMQHDQLYHSIQHINAEIAVHQDNVLPVYTAYLKDAYEDVQRSLLRNIYQENRAFQYWALQDRQLEANDLNIATQAAKHERLVADIDNFRENNEAFSPFRQKLEITAARYPNEFAAMLQSGSLAFSLDIRTEPGFENMRYIIARSFKLEFPEIAGGKNVLFLNLIHSGQAVLNSDIDRDKPGALHVFSHRPRIRLYKIDYKDRENTAGGNLGEGDQGYIGLSPFTQWRIDFDLKGNEWLDLTSIKTVLLTFEGRTLGPNRRLN